MAIRFGFSMFFKTAFVFRYISTPSTSQPRLFSGLECGKNVLRQGRVHDESVSSLREYRVEKGNRGGRREELAAVAEAPKRAGVDASNGPSTAKVVRTLPPRKTEPPPRAAS